MSTPDQALSGDLARQCLQSMDSMSPFKDDIRSNTEDIYFPVGIKIAIFDAKKCIILLLSIMLLEVILK